MGEVSRFIKGFKVLDGVISDLCFFFVVVGELDFVVSGS